MNFQSKYVAALFDQEDSGFQKLKRTNQKSSDPAIPVIKEVRRLLKQNRYDQALGILTRLPNHLIKKQRKMIKKIMKEYLDHAIKRFPGTPYIKEVILKLHSMGLKFPEFMDIRAIENEALEKKANKDPR